MVGRTVEANGRSAGNAMNEAYEFLNLYKRLEDLLESKLNVSETRRGSVVVEFMNSTEGEPYREKLNLCREIRNIMTHNADLDGEPVVMPSDAVVDSLREIVAAIERPPQAGEYATPIEHILTARMEDFALNLMRTMEKNGFSHVPVLRQGLVEGVFSVSTIFSAAIRSEHFTLDEEARVEDFLPLLPPERHLCEQFRFVRADATLPEACRAFETKGRERRKRVAAIFLTEDGTPESRLCGMLTPWDLIAGRFSERRKRLEGRQNMKKKETFNA